MADHGHVGRPVAGSQAHEVVVEDYIHDPVQAVFDPPMGAGCMQELPCRDRRGRQEMAHVVFDRFRRGTQKGRAVARAGACPGRLRAPGEAGAI